MGHHFARAPLGVQSVRKNVPIKFRVLSSIPKLESSVLTALTTKSATNLVVEPPVTVGLVLCSAVVLDVTHVSFANSFFFSNDMLAPPKEMPAKGELFFTVVNED